MSNKTTNGSNILEDGNSKYVLTGDWRNRRPVHIREKCTNCMMCVAYCPDNCIYQENNILTEFDLNYCKGCGVCAKVCPFKAIEMKDEE
jgi:pyruvate ferredoxin oxidoreductase delta subunit